MSRDKQNEIHELAKQMSEAISTEVEKRYIEDEAKLQAALIENGWRKASEVAEDIIRILRAAGINEHRYPVIAELKKKYTEEVK